MPRHTVHTADGSLDRMNGHNASTILVHVSPAVHNVVHILDQPVAACSIFYMSSGSSLCICRPTRSRRSLLVYRFLLLYSERLPLSGLAVDSHAGDLLPSGSAGNSFRQLLDADRCTTKLATKHECDQEGKSAFLASMPNNRRPHASCERLDGWTLLYVCYSTSVQ